eukprot:6068545-Prymnesium_polylepis.1
MHVAHLPASLHSKVLANPSHPCCHILPPELQHQESAVPSSAPHSASTAAMDSPKLTCPLLIAYRPSAKAPRRVQIEVDARRRATQLPAPPNTTSVSVELVSIAVATDASAPRDASTTHVHNVVCSSRSTRSKPQTPPGVASEANTPRVTIVAFVAGETSRRCCTSVNAARVACSECAGVSHASNVATRSFSTCGTCGAPCTGAGRAATMSTCAAFVEAVGGHVTCQHVVYKVVASKLDPWRWNDGCA